MKRRRRTSVRRDEAPVFEPLSALLGDAWREMSSSETIAFRQRWQRAYSDRVCAQYKHRTCDCRRDHPLPHPVEGEHEGPNDASIGFSRFDWHAFSGLASNGDDASWAALLALAARDGLEEVVLFPEWCKTPGAWVKLDALLDPARRRAIERMSDCYVSAPDLRWTYVRTHEALGPWLLTPDTELNFDSTWGLPANIVATLRDPALPWRDPRAWSAAARCARWQPPDASRVAMVLAALDVADTELAQPEWRATLDRAWRNAVGADAQLEQLVARGALPLDAIDSTRRFARGTHSIDTPLTRAHLVPLDQTHERWPASPRDGAAIACAWPAVLGVELQLRELVGAQRFVWRVARGVPALDLRDSVEDGVRAQIAALGMLATDVRDGVAHIVCPPL